MLYLDQPAQVGYSSGPLTTSTEKIVDHFIIFITKFFQEFHEFKDSKLYIAGESFAGSWIPYIASRIIQENRKPNVHFNLQAILLGNGWIDPYTQYPAYLSFAIDKKLISGEYQKLAEAQLRDCMVELEPIPRKFMYDTCEATMITVLDYSKEGYLIIFI
jgi:carboxypeptidase D